MKKNQNGFGIVEIFLIVVTVIILAALGWVAAIALNKPKIVIKQVTSVPSSKNETPQTIALDKTYVDETGNFSFNYPSSWNVKTETGEQTTDYPTTTSTLTAPDGTVLNAKSNWGGKGGACLPDQGEKCPSDEYLTAERLPITNVYYVDSYVTDASGNSQPVLKPADIKLVTRHYANEDGESLYQIGIMDSSAKNPLELNKSKSGFILPEIFFTVYNSTGKFQPYIYLYSEGKDASFLTSKDAVTIKTILRTLKVTS